MVALLRGRLRTAAALPHIWWGVSVENRRHGLPRLALLRTAPAQVRFLSIEPLLKDLGPLDLTGIHWVIVGGESGPRARPMHPDWVRHIRDQCIEKGVPFFFKQWGGVRKSETGRELDGETWDQMPSCKSSRPRSGADANQFISCRRFECALLASTGFNHPFIVAFSGCHHLTPPFAHSRADSM